MESMKDGWAEQQTCRNSTRQGIMCTTEKDDAAVPPFLSMARDF
jgi:hypothetical protein